MSKICYIRNHTVAIDVSEILALAWKSYSLNIMYQSGVAVDYTDITKDDFVKLSTAWEAYQEDEKYQLTKYEIQELCNAAIAQATGLKLIDTYEGNAKKSELKSMVAKIRERINETTD